MFLRQLVIFHFVLMIVTIPLASLAQTKAQSKYSSAEDQSLNFRKIAILPVQDNLSGIYGGKIQEALIKNYQDNPHWSLVPENQKDADAYLIGKVARRLTKILYHFELKKTLQEKPLFVEERETDNETDLEKVTAAAVDVVEKLRQKIPYDGFVLSRKGQRVTLDLGSKDGVEQDEQLSIVHFWKINKHPELGFIVGTDKEILGQIKVVKVEEHLSFGVVLNEKEQGLIQKDMKIDRRKFSEYPDPGLAPDGTPLDGLNNRKDRDMFGDSPRLWKPEDIPQFGEVHFLGGLGSEAASASLITSGTQTGSSQFNPFLKVGAEMWLTQKLFLGFDIEQSVGKIGSVSTTFSTNEFIFGYNLWMDEAMHGTKMQFALSIFQAQFGFPDQTPLVYTTTNWNAKFFKFKLLTPVTEDQAWEAGAKLNYGFQPSVSESSPSGGGSSAVRILHFSLLGVKHISPKWSWLAELNFQSYSAQFSTDITDRSPPNEASSQSVQKQTVGYFGMSYAF